MIRNEMRREFPAVSFVKRRRKCPSFGKDGEKGFDGAVTSLMMQTYLCNCDFRKRVNKNGKEYGWDVAVYSSPEHIYGYDHIVQHMCEIYPIATERQIWKILK